MSPTHKIDNQDHMVIMSQLYPAVYTQLVPQQGDAVTKPRRRRRKNKGGGGENGGSGSRKRKLSEEQVSMLEKNFGNERKLESERKDKLALELGLDPRQVAVWFQNRRARWKNKKLEEEYSMLKSTNESIVVEKCQLESEVFKLKEKLCEAEKEIQRLSILSMVYADRITISSESPSSSVLSMETIEPPLLGEFGEFGMVDAYDQDPFYMTADQANNYVNHGMDQWINLYN